MALRDSSRRFSVSLPARAALLTLAAGLLAAPLPANAGLYCCNDAQGKKICGDTMPKSCVGRDTQLKDERGTRQLVGQLTPEQIAQREEEAKRKKQEEEAKKEQRRKDQALINTYSSVKDIDVARARAEKDVTDQIKAAEAKIEAATKRRKKAEAEAEFYKNKPLPDDVRRALKDTEFEIKAQGELIESKKKDFDGIKTKFDAEKARYEELMKARAAPR